MKEIFSYAPPPPYFIHRSAPTRAAMPTPVGWSTMPSAPRGPAATSPPVGSDRTGPSVAPAAGHVTSLSTALETCRTARRTCIAEMPPPATEGMTTAMMGRASYWMISASFTLVCMYVPWLVVLGEHSVCVCVCVGGGGGGGGGGKKRKKQKSVGMNRKA